MKKSFAEQRNTIANEVLSLIKSSFEISTVCNLKFVSGRGQDGMTLNEDEMYRTLKDLDQN